MVKPLYIQKTGSVYFHADDNTPLTDLKPVLSQHCERRYRRIDRFTQLALIGAARCARQSLLPADTPLLLASGKGPASNNIAMQETLIKSLQPPMPVQFINAVSNSVGFYVMQDHNLAGQSLFVSREYHSFEAALRLASVDLAMLSSQTALLGVVDEITQPLSAQRKRLGLGHEVQLGEGSHWFLLSSELTEQSVAVISHCRLYPDFQALEIWLNNIGPGQIKVFFGQGMAARLRECCLSCLPDSTEIYTTAEALWDGLNAGAICSHLNEIDSDVVSDSSAGKGSLLLISCDNSHRFQATLVERV